MATVGAHEASVSVDGWVYGIEGGNVEWVDPQGTTHVDGWPSCLNPAGQAVRITFGEMPVTTPDGSWWKQVVWVRCGS